MSLQALQSQQVAFLCFFFSKDFQRPKLFNQTGTMSSAYQSTVFFLQLRDLHTLLAH